MLYPGCFCYTVREDATCGPDSTDATCAPASHRQEA